MVADAISDSVLDAILAQDKTGRVSCETLVTTGLAFIAGEITTECYVDIPKIVRETIREIGYSSSRMGFDYQTCSVITSIDRQSPEIAQGGDFPHQPAVGSVHIVQVQAVGLFPESLPVFRS